MPDNYFTVNMRAYLDKNVQTYIGEESLNKILSEFSCLKNYGKKTLSCKYT